MKLYLGIDLGSTTSKAILLDEREAVVGRGITNTRSNYDVAVEVARREAMVDARLAVASAPLAGHAEQVGRAFHALGDATRLAPRKRAGEPFFVSRQARPGQEVGDPRPRGGAIQPV